MSLRLVRDFIADLAYQHGVLDGHYKRKECFYYGTIDLVENNYIFITRYNVVCRTPYARSRNILIADPLFAQKLVEWFGGIKGGV